MSDDGEHAWNLFPADCLKFHLPYKKLCRKCLLLSDQLRHDSEVQNKVNETHFHKTLETTLKLYQSYDTWENFKKAADMLAEMHRRAKRRLNMVYESSFSSGGANFSRDFIMKFQEIYAEKNFLSNQKPFPVSTLEHILCSSSDPPIDAFKRRRRILKARRSRIPSHFVHPVLPFCSSSEDDMPNPNDDTNHHLSSTGNCSSLPSVSKRQRIDPSILNSPASSVLSNNTRSHSPSTCSVCSDEYSSEEGFQCSCSDNTDNNHSP